MRRPVRASLVAFALTGLLGLLDVSPAWAQQHTVLTLVATRREAPASVVDDIIYTELNERFGESLDYYSEHLDVARFSDPEYSSVLGMFLKEKYSGYDFDLVIAPTDATVDLLRDRR